VPDLIREREGRPLNRSRVYKLASALLATLSVAGCTPTGQAPIESDEGSVAPVVKAPLTRVAFGSCAFQWAEQPIFRTIVDAEPDLYLSLGDAIYGDFDGETTFDVTPESLREEWGNYPHERRRLFELIGATGAEGVILLSGNVHFAEISRTDEGPYLLYDFTSSGLTHVNEEYPKAPNRHRVAGPFVDLNFGLIEIDWDQGIVSLRAIGTDGVPTFEQRVGFGDLTTDGASH